MLPDVLPEAPLEPLPVDAPDVPPVVPVGASPFTSAHTAQAVTDQSFSASPVAVAVHPPEAADVVAPSGFDVTIE